MITFSASLLFCRVRRSLSVKHCVILANSFDSFLTSRRAKGRGHDTTERKSRSCQHLLPLLLISVFTRAHNVSPKREWWEVSPQTETSFVALWLQPVTFPVANKQVVLIGQQHLE